jgi:hypothetical protein
MLRSILIKPKMATLKKFQLLKETKSIFSKVVIYGIVLMIVLLPSLNTFSKSLSPKAIAPIITSSSNVTGAVGVAFTYIITAVNTPTSFSTSSLPSGLSINTSTGVISGTPTVAGNFADTIRAINSDGTVSQILTITIISAWGLTGNSGTSPTSNFIGTSDNQDVVFKRNNVKAGLLGSNTAFGLVSLFTDTTAGNNSAFGNSSLYFNTGSYNTAVGSSSLYYNSTGTNNTAEGFNSLFNNRSASFNTSFGQACLYSNTTGAYNTAAGGSALYNNISAYYNTAFGYQSLYKNIGSGNTGIGYQSLYADSIGNFNTAIGYKADVTTASTSFAIALGYNAIASANQLYISDSIHTIKAKGLPTGRGYVLTDTAGNGNLSLQLNAGTTAWNLNGNSGTNPTSNFIGTTDTVDVVFKRNGVKAGLLNASLLNTSWGVAALSSNTIGPYNTGIGYSSLLTNSTGGFNTSIGTYCLANNSNANYNTGVGYASLNQNTGGANTSIGALASQHNTTGQYNTAVGVSSLNSNLAASYNTAIGGASLFSNKSGAENTAIGYNSLNTNTTGQYNTAVGYQAVADTGALYALSLGYNSTATSNQLALSDSIHTIKAKGLSTGAGYVLTDVSGNGNLSLQPSAGSTAWSFNGNSPTSGVSYLGSSNNVSLRFRTYNTEKMIIDSIGRVGIGVTNITDTSYKLYVEKGIRTRKVQVDIASWSDFVFDNNYKLPSLTSVENFIQQNRHLPDVPSASEVEQNGIDLGNNQKILLQKVEELTLYTIAQNKELIDQNKEIEDQSKEITELKDQQNQLQELKKEVDDLKVLLQKSK